MERCIITAFFLSCFIVGMLWGLVSLKNRIEPRYISWWMRRHPEKLTGKHTLTTQKYDADDNMPLLQEIMLVVFTVAAMTFIFSITLAARAGYIS